MINLQQNKQTLKSYNQLLAATLSSFTQKPTSLQHEQSARLANPSPTKRSSEETHSGFGRTISKMIKIEFQEGNRSRHNQEVKLKRKMLTSSQKFQNRKKTARSNCLKQICTKPKPEIVNHSDITIGSHSIQKMDYTMTLYTKDFNFIDDSTLRRKLKHSANISESKSTTLKEQPKVLILKKTETNRIQELLFKPSKTSRLPSASKMRQRLTDRVYSSNPKASKKAISIEQFIPIRKNSTKKEPFVCGLNEKQQNLQKNKEKLLIYQDFLWKVNYSNGLYIKPSDTDTVYKAFIGHGNNSNLIKGILRRRYWWTIADKSDGCNFVWTQLKINSIFKQAQTNSKMILSKLYQMEQQINSNIKMKTEPIIRLQEGHQKIFNSTDLLNWCRHMKKYRKSEVTLSERTYKNRVQLLNCKQIVRIDNAAKITLHNHLQQNYYIGNKKSLFYHMKNFYDLQKRNVFQVIPLTFHISKGLEDGEYKSFVSVFEDLERKKGKNVKNVWIMKPGENSNRGIGITVCYSLEEIKYRIKAREKNNDGSLRTFIIQKYIENPLLYKGRKFDIRHYLLLTSFNGILKAYWYPQGYVRTSSSQFSLKKGTNMFVHLTNDAIQKNADEYGKYEKGNKISYQKFQHYLNKVNENHKRNCFFQEILPQMKKITLEAVKSTFLSLDPNKKEHNFELLGMDFMIDQDLHPWLIEINTNPCLQLSCPLLSKIIPNIIQNTLRLCVDPFFPPPQECSLSKKLQIGDNPLEQNNFELIFDQSVDRESVLSIFGGDVQIDAKMGKIEEDVETFQNEGTELWQEKL